MAKTLTGKQIKDSYGGVLIIKDDNTGLNGTEQAVSDGLGNESTLSISTAKVKVSSAPVDTDDVVRLLELNVVSGNLATHEADTANPHSVTKAQVGLSNADNTSDAAKPVSTAQQTALDLKANAIDLTNVDNTSDANKPVSTAQQTALDLKANKANDTLTGATLTTSSINAVTPTAAGLGATLYLDDAGNYTAPPSAGGGEANTSSNVGAGEGLAKTKVGVDLPFKTLTAGANITLNSTTNEIEIVASGGSGDVTAASNIGNNLLVRGDGAVKGVQNSGISVDDSDNITGVSEITAGDIPVYEILGNRVTTGVIDGAGELTINGGDGTKFDISDGSGVVVDAFATPEAPAFTKVTWSSLTAITPTFASSQVTFIAINISGTVIQQATQFTIEQRKSLIVLGPVSTPDGTNIDSTGDNSHSIGDGYLSSALTAAVGMVNISGNNFSAASTNLTIRKEAGNTFEENINRDINAKDPHFKTSAVDTGVTYIGIYSDGAGGITTILSQTNINPNQYDDGTGSLGTVPNNKYTNPIIFFLPDSNTTVVQFGETIYNNLAEAESDIANLNFTVLDPSLNSEAIRTILSVKKGTTDLSVALDAVFSDTGKFGLGTSGGGAAGGTFQDMQDTYDNSVSPEIITDSTRGAVTVQRGSASDTDNVIEVKNGAGTTTFEVDGNGNVTANSLTLASDNFPIGIALSDETTDLTTGTAKATFRMPFAFTLTDVRANVNTAPTGSVLTVDINETGSTILSTKITIDATEKTSVTATIPPVISDANLADDAEITIDIDTVGSTIAGTGLKIWLIGTRA